MNNALKRESTMMFQHTPRAPHTLRFVTFVLRVALGVYLFYFGLNHPSLLLEKLRENALTSGLYASLSAPHNISGSTIASQWIFFVIGVCLAVGLMTRIASWAGIVIMGLIYASNINLSHISVPQLVNEELIVILSLLVIIFSKAGRYLGLDKVMHFSLWRKK